MKNLSNQGSLKSHFLQEFFKEPVKVSRRTFNEWFFNMVLWSDDIEEPFLVP